MKAEFYSCSMIELSHSIGHVASAVPAAHYEGVKHSLETIVFNCERFHQSPPDRIQRDLGSSDGPPRNWKGIGIAMVVIVAVMSLVILSVILLTPDESHLLLRSHLTMEDLESDEFKVHDPCVAWLNDNEVALRTREGHVLSFSLNTNLTTTLLDNSSLDLTATKFQVSADKRFVLVAYNIRPVFTQSFTASYAIYNVANGDLLELNPLEREKATLQYASWGPQGNQLAYVSDGDIYYKPSVTSNPLRLTTTDEEQNVVNGLSDWTYEEEVLLTYVAHWWSMDGARLAYLTINNSATPVMEIPHFLGGLYPSNVLFPYPKAGSSIPSVSLFVVNLYGPAHTLEMMPPDSLRARDSYISMVTWISSTRLAVRWLNRAQNQSVLCVCEATTGACSEVNGHQSFRISKPSGARCNDVPLFSADGSMFYTILPAKQGARGEFHHIAGLSAQPAIPSVPPRFLTSGSWDVTLLCALDEKAGKIVDLDGVFQRRCISCNLIDGCGFFKAEFSPNQTHFTLYCLGYVVLEDNSPLCRALEDKRLPETLFRTLPADNHDLHLKLSLPQGYEANLHPLLIIVLLMQLPYIDDRRMVLYGKAFGGYLTLKMLAATDKLFQCTAAAAPITDFRLYSAAFSERYLGLPAKEEHAYSTASLLEEVNKLKDENFLILHGTADARVHFQHSAELLSRLVRVEANYSLQLYPDEGHILREPRSIQHFQRTVVNYLQTCLKHSILTEPIEDDEEDDD
ncbi:Inactive dipeptidyl peptidase 10 [Collichthys lucidus]|uniref:Inactive dipeptidyl peptidase 10 n=1 Tax=Collichthys lucidus TaxID=240159 RepID=A0A4U5UNV0_COLLU|nr:Inactive dipeptidyl peptidase 10 [Collichthys lucidus]